MKKFKKLINLTFAVLWIALFAFGVWQLYLRKIYPTTYKNLVVRYAQEGGISPSFVFAIVRAESNFRADALSAKGAVGLMQLLPETALFVAQRFSLERPVDLTDPACNLRLGCLYLSYLKARFSSDTAVLAAYNAGEGNVRLWLSDSRYSENGADLSAVPFAETARYVKRVKKIQNKYKKLYDFP